MDKLTSFLQVSEKGFFNDLPPSKYFNDLKLSGLWIIKKIVLANLCKPIHDDITVPVSSGLLNLKNMECKGEK